MRGIGMVGRRGPKALKRRKFRRPWDASEGVSKPWRCPASPAACFLPDATQGRSLWVIIIKIWYKAGDKNRRFPRAIRDQPLDWARRPRRRRLPAVHRRLPCQPGLPAFGVASKKLEKGTCHVCQSPHDFPSKLAQGPPFLYFRLPGLSDLRPRSASRWR